MKTFLAIYIGTQDKMATWNAMSPEQRKQREAEGMSAWNAWAKQHAASIVQEGAPLGKTKRADAKGISDTRNQMSAYTIVKAESHEQAAKMFEKHPHFTIFPGEAVEIMECLPMPKM